MLSIKCLAPDADQSHILHNNRMTWTATGWLGNWKSREQEWEWESGNKHWTDWSKFSVCTLTKLLSLAYCLFTCTNIQVSEHVLPHAAVTDMLAKISYMAIHWREHRHSHSCSVSHSLAAFPEWLTSELLKFQHILTQSYLQLRLQLGIHMATVSDVD